LESKKLNIEGALATLCTLWQLFLSSISSAGVSEFRSKLLARINTTRLTMKEDGDLRRSRTDEAKTPWQYMHVVSAWPR